MMKLTLFTLLAIFLYDVNGECIRNGVRCLEYTVLEMHEEYEVREYPPIVWVSVSGQARRKMDISRSLIKQLYAYLGGANDREEKLNMTVPVRTTKIVDSDVNNYIMAIPLLPEQSENPPVPTNENVTVTREPKTVYVTSYRLPLSSRRGNRTVCFCPRWPGLVRRFPKVVGKHQRPVEPRCAGCPKRWCVEGDPQEKNPSVVKHAKTPSGTTMHAT